MEILLAGGSGRLMDGLIDKFRKEGHRVYVLTGNRYRNSAYHKVFEKYYFPYDSDVIMEIFESVNPDLVVFLGAYDTNFMWNKDCEKEAVRFQAGLVNLLIAFAGRKKGRFVYLSSQEVFTGHFKHEITEETPVAPGNVKAMALAQGEELCQSYGKNFDADTVVLRLDNVYNVPTNRNEVRDVCSLMCLEAAQTGQINVRDNETFHMLHEADAVEFVFRVSCAVTHESPVYNISSGELVTHEKLAAMIREKMEDSIGYVISPTADKNRRVLSSALYDGEFGMRIFHGVEETVEETISTMKKHPEAFQTDGRRGNGFFARLKNRFYGTVRALVPFLENVVAFVPFFMLNNRAVGSDYFQNLDFYLLYVLLFAIVHGQQQAVFSGVLAVAGYCFRQMYDRTGFDVMLDYNTYVWIAQLFILGLVVGYMRDQIRIIKGEDEQEMDYLSGLLGDIEDINDSNVRMKNVLETQIVNQNDSMGRLYDITSSLEKYSPEEVLFYAAEVLARVVGSSDVAIYNVANRSYARLFSSTSQKARMLGNSVNYTELGPVYEALSNKKVYINKEMDERYPLMANAIYSEEDMQIIIMIWGIPWERMTLGQANMLTVVSYLIQNATVRANRYLEALEYKRYVEGTNVLGAEAFAALVRAYLTAKERGLTECAFLSIDYGGRTLEEAGSEVAKLLRQTDFVGELEDGDLYVLLANSNEEAATNVISRFEENGFGCKIMEAMEV